MYYLSDIKPSWGQMKLLKGVQLLPVNKEEKDKIRREWRVLLVYIEEEKVLPQFLWNLSHFESRAGSLPIKEGKYGN